LPTSLVTGGTGFIGSHLADALLRMGHRVVVVDDLSGGFAENVDPRALFLRGSCTDPAFVDEVFARHSFDYVFHFAAYAAEGLSHFTRRFIYTNNLIGSVNVLNAAVNQGAVRRFLFASSIAVYGTGQTPLHEDTVPRPEDPYGIAKYAVELDLEAAERMFGLEYAVFRLHNVYGERQHHGDRYRNVIGIFMNQVLRGEPCTIFGDGLQTRAFTHWEDVSAVMAAAAELPAAKNRVFNLGADQPTSVLELAEKVQQVMGKRTGVRHLEARREVVHAWSDHARARELLGYRTTVELPDGLARMAAWVKQVGPRERTPFSEIEIARELPRTWAPDAGS
jgi:UDP-glucose 4-epimerase